MVFQLDAKKSCKIEHFQKLLSLSTELNNLMKNEFGRIILPIDGSKIAKKAGKKALVLAKTSGLEVVAIHVINTPDLPGLYGYQNAISYDEMHKFLQKNGQFYLDEIEKMGKKMGVKVSKKLVEGHPAEEIIKEAKKNDLIVIGSKGSTALERIFLGSVTENVAHHASCPVMIVR